MQHSADTWREFVQQIQSLPGQREQPYIVESWKRCREAGLEPAPDQPLLRRIGAGELGRRLTANQSLIDVTAPILTDFSVSLGGLSHVVYLTDADGIVLWSVGNDVLMLAYGLVPGFDWSEGVMGTNGAGTALATDRPVAVIGPDHYQLPFHESTCLGAPIHGPAGELMGAIDFSTSVDDADPAQLAQVAHLAHLIESEIAGAGEAWMERRASGA